MTRGFLARLIRNRAPDAGHGAGPSAGALFRHRPGYGPIEYAEVIDVAVDPVGIRHVRFRLYFGYRDKTVEAGDRTLAAAAFTRRFDERIAPPAAGLTAGAAASDA